MKFVLGQKIIDICRGKSKLGISSHLKNYCYNNIVTHIPVYFIRKFYLKRVLGYKIGKNAFIHLGCFILSRSLEIGEDTVIGRNVKLIGEIKIGKHCSITQESFLQAVTHEKNSPVFKALYQPIVIDDYVWVGIRSVVLPGVVIGKGAIVGANSTVTKNVATLDVVAGSPAKKIGVRSSDACAYNLNYCPFLH